MEYFDVERNKEEVFLTLKGLLLNNVKGGEMWYSISTTTTRE